MCVFVVFSLLTEFSWWIHRHSSSPTRISLVLHCINKIIYSTPQYLLGWIIDSSSHLHVLIHIFQDYSQCSQSRQIKSTTFVARVEWILRLNDDYQQSIQIDRTLTLPLYLNRVVCKIWKFYKIPTPMSRRPELWSHLSEHQTQVEGENMTKHLQNHLWLSLGLLAALKS